MRELFDNRILIRLSLLIYIALIFILSSMSFKDTGSGFMLNDKIIHFIEYAGLGYLLMKYFSINRGKDLKLSALLSLIFGSIYALSDEIHQGFVGYFDTGIFGGVRDPDPFDFAADVTGISFMVLIFILKRRNIIFKTNLQE